MSVTVRRATEADFLAFYNRAPDRTVLGFVGEDGDEIISIGGLAIAEGRAMAFFDATRDLHSSKVLLHKTALKVLDEARALGFRRVYALRSENYPTARRWLERLGFTPCDDDETVYIWLNS